VHREIGSTMKAHHILLYLGMLVMVLVVALVSGQMQDEAQRVRFTMWAIPVALIVAVLVRYFASGRDARPARDLTAPSRTVAKDEPAMRSVRPISVRRVLWSTSIAGGLLILGWICLVYRGSVGDQEGQFTALLWIRIVTTVVTTVVALVLSKFAPEIRAQKVWVLQLAAVSQVGLAFVGLIVVPFVALTIWNDYVDFQAYSLKPGFLLLLLPTAAVVFCLTRGGSSKNRED
jgi:hypothetical protein